MKVAETPAGNQQRETVHGPPFYVAGNLKPETFGLKKKIIQM